MVKKILDSRILYVILSILISISLWFYVTSLEGNEVEQPVNNIPVHFEGIDILEEKNLFIVGNAPTVSLRVRGPSNILTRLNMNKEDINVTVNVSKITSAGETTLGYNISFPSYASGTVSTVSRNPNNVTFNVARSLEREITDIRGRFTGTVAEGYVPGDVQDFKFSPSAITVSGEVSQVNQVSYILVTVDVEDRATSVAGDYPFQLIGNDGEPLKDVEVTTSADTVYVSFPIRAIKEVPLKVNLVPGGGITESNVRCEIEPVSSITVAGSKEDVDAINEIVLRTVELSTIRNGDVMTMQIPLTDALENLSGTKEVTVSFRISGAPTKTVETTNISFINAPDGWEATLITQSMSVELRGTPPALSVLSGENVRVVANLADIELVAGTYTLKPELYLENVGSSAAILGTDYRVVVSLSRQE